MLVVVLPSVVSVVLVVVVVLVASGVVVLVVVLSSVVSVVLVVVVVLLAHASGSHTPEPMLVPPRFAQRSAERCSHLTLPRSASSSSSSSSSSVMQQRILPGCGQVSSSQGPLPGITIPCRRSHSSAVTTLQSFSFSSSSKMQHRTRLSLSRS
ncbi:MAG: hypothetical protein E6J71_28805 [Deltaproteobacteria bacterium]|nr:MAG: hypothetical protein E6J71_28805 [Deltaproteobacteria bacterium]